jgi:hypothetical protein
MIQNGKVKKLDIANYTPGLLNIRVVLQLVNSVAVKICMEEVFTGLMLMESINETSMITYDYA